MPGSDDVQCPYGSTGNYLRTASNNDSGEDHDSGQDYDFEDHDSNEDHDACTNNRGKIHSRSYQQHCGRYNPKSTKHRL